MIIFCIVIIITVVHSMYPPVRKKHILYSHPGIILMHIVHIM